MHFNLCWYIVLTCHVCRHMLWAFGVEEYEGTKHTFHWSTLSASSLFNASTSVPSFQANCFSLSMGFYKPVSLALRNCSLPSFHIQNIFKVWLGNSSYFCLMC